MTMINKVKLFINNNIKSRKVAKIVEDSLLKEKFTIVEDDDFDLGIAVGGDGSFLRMINKSHFNDHALYVGINAGTLGFAQDISIDEINSFIKSIKRNEFNTEKIGIQEIEVITKEEKLKFNCLNEVVIRDEELNTLHTDILIDNNLLENYVGDGLLVSTSFGSTAYNLSFGGSIVYNSFDTLQITPIAPLNNKSYYSLPNSIIIPASIDITIIPKANRNNLLLTIDGNNIFLIGVLEINIKISEHIKIIRKKDYNFIKKINDKFIK